MGNMNKTELKPMARGWIDGNNLMVQYASWSGPWDKPIVLREATDKDRETYGTTVPWAAREFPGGTSIPERDPSYRG